MNTLTRTQSGHGKCWQVLASAGESHSSSTPPPPAPSSASECRCRHHPHGPAVVALATKAHPGREQQHAQEQWWRRRDTQLSPDASQPGMGPVYGRDRARGRASGRATPIGNNDDDETKSVRIKLDTTAGRSRRAAAISLAGSQGSDPLRSSSILFTCNRLASPSVMSSFPCKDQSGRARGSRKSIAFNCFHRMQQSTIDLLDLERPRPLALLHSPPSSSSSSSD